MRRGGGWFSLVPLVLRDIVIFVSLARASLLPRQLFVKLGHVVVPLGLVAGPGHRGAQPVFLPEALELELPSVVPAAVGEDRLCAGQRVGLLVDQPDVPVETCAFGRAGAHVVRHDAAAGHVVPLHVDHQEVMPFPVGRAKR